MTNDTDRNPDAVAHFQDGVRAALRKIETKIPSRYRGVVADTAREMGVDLSEHA